MNGFRAARLWADTFEFLHGADQHRDLASLNAAFRSCVAPLGFVQFIRVGITGPGGTPIEEDIQGAWDPRWQARYFGRGYGQIDPAISRATTDSAPFTWGDLKTSAPLTAAQREFFGEAEDYGGFEGFVTPLRTLDGSFAVVTLSGKDVDDAPDTRTALHVMSIYYAGAARALLDRNSNEPRRGLTPRQRDLLSFIASGYTQREAAERMGLSQKTVEQYLANARLRLNVRTTAQLCVEAMRHGHIQI